MKKLFVLHPFLFALIPIFFLYSHNIEEVNFQQTILPSIVLILFVLIIQTLLTFIITDKKKKGVVISFFLFIFFTYGTFYKIFEGFSIAGFTIGRDRYLFIIWCLIFILGVYFIVKTKKNFGGVNTFLNVGAISLSVLIIVPVAAYGLKGISATEENLRLSLKNYSSLELDEREKLPNIFYIILDGYGSSNTLKTKYGYDNSGFENFLKGKGFYIASKSHSNYSTTMLSLASSLNMEHLIKLVKTIDVPLLYEMIQGNEVMRFLKSKGYKTIDISSNIGKLQHIREADLNETPGNFMADEFHITLVELTLLKAFEKHLNFTYFYREKILRTFSECSEIQSEVEKPFFAFVHILPPHPPYVFGPNAEPLFGSLRLDDWGNLWEQKERYRDQVIFVDDMMKKVITKILLEAESEPIIIIQGDHGPQLWSNSLLATDEEIKARMEIFNAYYLPKKDSTFFYDSITPVNTFRLIFNHYFHTNYELLEDKSYFTLYELPYKFLDASDKLLIPDSIHAKQLP